MELRWANLNEEQLAFLKQLENNFVEKFGEKFFIMAVDDTKTK